MKCSVSWCSNEAAYVVGTRAVCEADVRTVPDEHGSGAIPIAAC